MLKKDIKKEETIVELPDTLEPQEEIKLPEEKVSKTENIGGIEINMPSVQTRELPLVIKLPADASMAQIAYAKTINAYAYQNPKKFAKKKDEVIKRLMALKDAPDPIEGNLKINKSSL
jgi:hypothetical protein